MHNSRSSCEFYFLLLRNDPYEKHWHDDSDRNKTYTMLKKNNPFMAGFRQWELNGPKETAASSGERTTKTPSLGDAVISLIANEKNTFLIAVQGVPRDSGRHRFVVKREQVSRLWRCVASRLSCESGLGELGLGAADEDGRETMRVRRTIMKTKVWRTIFNQVRLPLFSRCP